MKIKRLVPAAVAGILLMPLLVFGTAGTASAAPDYQKMVNGDGDTAGKCLELDPVGQFTVQLGGCYPGVEDYQLWHYHPIGNGVFEIWSGTGGCVNAKDRPLGSGVVVSDCFDSFSSWTPTTWGNWTRWRNVATNLCLDVRDFGRSNVVQMWTCLDQGNQKWKMTL